MTLHWETAAQKGKRYFETITKLGGKIKVRNRVTGIFFDGSENALFIPLNDFGYSLEHGVFRKSIYPKYKSEIDF